jgi:hypothetical protein
MTKSAGSKTYPLMKSSTARSTFGRSGSISRSTASRHARTPPTIKRAPAHRRTAESTEPPGFISPSPRSQSLFEGSGPASCSMSLPSSRSRSASAASASSVSSSSDRHRNRKTRGPVALVLTESSATLVLVVIQPRLRARWLFLITKKLAASRRRLSSLRKAS